MKKNLLTSFLFCVLSQLIFFTECQDSRRNASQEFSIKSNQTYIVFTCDQFQLKVTKLNIDKFEHDIKVKNDEINNNTKIEISCCIIELNNVYIEDELDCLAIDDLTPNLTLIAQSAFFYDDLGFREIGAKFCSTNSANFCKSSEINSKVQNIQLVVNVGNSLPCESRRLKADRRRADFTIIMQFEPRISLRPKRIVIEQRDQEFNVSCIVHGHPIPSVIWMKDNEPLIFNGLTSVHTNDSILEIIEQQLNECTLVTYLKTQAKTVQTLGSYSCHAVNPIGRVQLSVSIQASSFTIFSRYRQKPINVGGFILGMLTPLLISIYIILKLGYRSRYAINNEEEGIDDY